MKLNELELEEGYSPSVIPNLYNILAANGHTISDGDAGMASYAVWYFCRTRLKMPAKMVVISSATDAGHICELENEDVQLYNVLVKFGSSLYDHSGRHIANGLADQASKKYKDQSPEVFSEIDPYRDSCILKVLDTKTAWNTNWREFFATLDDNFRH